MAQRSHVPAFGNWDKNQNNGLFTAVSDNARKGKVGGKMINPNDPEQNPEMFAVDPPQPKATTNLRTGVEPSKNETRSSRTTSNAYQQQLNAGASYGEQNSKRSGRQPPDTPERGVVENSPLHSQAKSGGRVGLASSSSWEKKQAENNNGLVPRTLGRIRDSKFKSPERVAYVPKFGGWDESNPASADGYTGVFSKVREGKQSGGGNLNFDSTSNRRAPAYNEMSKRIQKASRTSNRRKIIREESREEMMNPDFNGVQDKGNPPDMFTSGNVINPYNFEYSSDSSEDQSDPQTPKQQNVLINIPKKRRWFQLWLKK